MVQNLKLLIGGSSTHTSNRRLGVLFCHIEGCWESGGAYLVNNTLFDECVAIWEMQSPRELVWCLGVVILLPEFWLQ